MNLWDFLAALKRRWYVAIPLLLVAGLAFQLIIADVDGEYRYDATVRFEYDQGEIAEYLEVPVAMRSLTQAIQIAVSDLETETRLDAQGLVAWYRIRTLDFARRPVLEITSEHPDEAVALSTLNAIHDDIVAELEAYQDTISAPASDRVTATPLLAIQIGRPPFAVSARSQLAFMAAIGLAALLLFGTIDRALTAISRRVQRRRDDRAFRREREGAARQAADRRRALVGGART